MNMLVEAMKTTREAYKKYESGKEWIEKFIDALTIVTTDKNMPEGLIKENLKLHITYYIQGSESFETFMQWVAPLKTDCLFNDKWWEEKLKQGGLWEMVERAFANGVPDIPDDFEEDLFNGQSNWD